MDQTPAESTEAATAEVDAPEAIDLTQLDGDELAAEYSRLTEVIDSLDGEKRTLDWSDRMTALKLQRNEVATAINTLNQAPVVEDVALVEPAAEADAAADAPAAEDAPVVEAAADAPAEETPAPVAEVTAPAAPADAPAPAAAEAPAATPEPTIEASTDASVQAGDTSTVDAASTTHTEQMETTVAQTPDSNEPTEAASADVVAAAEAFAAQAAGDLAGVTAAVATDGRPVTDPEGFHRPKAGYIAMGGQSVVQQGETVDFAKIGQMIEAVRSVRPGPSGGAVSGVIASLVPFEDTADMPVEVLDRNTGPDRATLLIAETVANFKRKRAGEGLLPGVTAAICEPLDIIRDIPMCGVVDSPFADSLPSRPIGRLGFQHFPAIASDEVADGVTMWSEDDQDAVDDNDTDTWKPTVDITCADAVPVKAQELVASARVDDSTEISQPERVEEFMHKLAVVRARVREQHLLTKFDATAHPYEATYTDVGSLVALIDAVNSLLPQLTYNERLNEGDYDLWLEPGHIKRLINDENRRLFAQTEAGRAAQLVAYLEDQTGVRVKFLRDFKSGSFGALSTVGGAADTLPELPDTNRVRLIAPADYLYSATGEQSTGWMVDGNLVRQNKKLWFSKEWISLAKTGCSPSATIDISSCANGARAAGVEPAACSPGS